MATFRNPVRPAPEDAQGFGYDIAAEGETVRLCVHGSVDMATEPELEAQLTTLRDAGFRQIVLDLSRLSFLDSTGLRMILRWTVAERSGGYSLAVVPGPPGVQRVFELTQTSALVTFVDA